jgi:superfamily II DNA helicase RecQ
VIHVAIAVEIKKGSFSDRMVELAGTHLVVFDKAHADGVITIVLTIPVDAIQSLGVYHQASANQVVFDVEGLSGMATGVSESYRHPSDRTDDGASDAQRETIYTRLREWRRQTAEVMHVPLGSVMSNVHLAGLAMDPPETLDALSLRAGMSLKKVGVFGNEILQVITQARADRLESGIDPMFTSGG